MHKCVLIDLFGDKGGFAGKQSHSLWAAWQKSSHGEKSTSPVRFTDMECLIHHYK